MLKFDESMRLKLLLKMYNNGSWERNFVSLLLDEVVHISKSNDIEKKPDMIWMISIRRAMSSKLLFRPHSVNALDVSHPSIKRGSSRISMVLNQRKHELRASKSRMNLEVTLATVQLFCGKCGSQSLIPAQMT